MKSGILVLSSVLLFNSSLQADIHRIRTTAADSSRVVFLALTPLSWEQAEHDSLDFIRFSDCPVTDSVGYPELPMITCLVAVPDSVDPKISYSFTDEHTQHVLPVYPSPAMVLFSDLCTASVVDSFVIDSTAYSSTDFWPAERVRLIGETRICDQRLLKIQLFPAQYRAFDSTLVSVTSFSVTVSYNSAEAVWSSIGLGSFQDMAQGSPIVGYQYEDQTYAPMPEYFGVVDPEDGPQNPCRMPDYVILCASGLYAECSNVIDSLAEHRVGLNGFDVATVLTDAVNEDFGEQGQTAINDETIRDFTEYMWNNWPQASVKKPEYLLLIGDHEDASFGSADWFLPTHIYDCNIGKLLIEDIGNDEWYAYMNGNREIDNDIPSMAVGRISIKNGTTIQTDTLSAIIHNIINMEKPVTQIPIPSYRRRITRLTGTGTEIIKNNTGTGYQFPYDWEPSLEWTSDFTEWLNYDFVTSYCGDGRDFTDMDGSLMSSHAWRDQCLSEYGKGAGIMFYSNHGSCHMFSAGLEWLAEYIPRDPYTKGARDSTFNNYQIESSLTAASGHAAPFALLLCCSAGSFNHTVSEHTYPQYYPELCSFEGSVSPPVPAYDFGTDCIGEKLFKNTTVPVAGVFCGSSASLISCYGSYGKGIIEAIFVKGYGRLGDAVMQQRLSYYDFSVSMDGNGIASLGQFNLLGDPALDISDYVRFPNSCDLVVYHGDFEVFPYPVETPAGPEMELSFIVRNNGRKDSEAFSSRITITDGSNTFTDYISCSGIPSKTERIFSYTWACPVWFDTPVELDVEIEADWQNACSDCWRPNNTASDTYQINDIYPFSSGWPVEVTGNISTTPLLLNLNNDPYIEVVALTGTSLTAFDYSGNTLWIVSDEDFQGYVDPLAVDLNLDGQTEILAAYDDGIKVISNTGSVLGKLETDASLFVAGNMHTGTGIEMCTVNGNTLSLYSWDASAMPPGFSEIASEDLGFRPVLPAVFLCCNDLDGDSFEDAVCLNGFFDSSIPPNPEVNSVSAYSWNTEDMIYQHTWNEYLKSISLSAGLLAEEAAIGYPLGKFEGSGYPALLIEPENSVPEISCSGANVLTSNYLMYGVFADWSAPTGADTYVLPSGRQCMAWNNSGEPFGSFPTSNFGGDTESSMVSPASLGNLDDIYSDDVLFSSVLDGDWTILAYNYDGLPLGTASDFPFTLPEDVSAEGGFAVADLDRDGKVEIVFGTNDGLLHCWKLGSCSVGYAPWCQFQHDNGRSGVLE
ncbi:hypothetical protein CSA37_08430 [Candidatus Fermentibacteria bacterium]|nr:MAG: hypothetical protein CSA37_08430 [Candidatus Fermentibacteria bacterium]